MGDRVDAPGTDKGVVRKAADKTVSASKEAVNAVIDNPGHAVLGAVIGTFLIPIPVLGTAVGAVVGGWVGEKNT